MRCSSPCICPWLRLAQPCDIEERIAVVLFGNRVRVHCDWVLHDLSSQRGLGELGVRLGAMSKDGGEVPACRWPSYEETLVEVGFEAFSVLLGLIVC